jgi:hypothetical protein
MLYRCNKKYKSCISIEKTIHKKTQGNLFALRFFVCSVSGCRGARVKRARCEALKPRNTRPRRSEAQAGARPNTFKNS